MDIGVDSNLIIMFLICNIVLKEAGQMNYITLAYNAGDINGDD